MWPGSTSRSSVILLLFVCVTGFNKSFLCHSPPVRLCGRVQQVVPLSFSSCSFVWPGSTSRSSVILLLFDCVAGFNKSFLYLSPPVRLYGRVQQVVPLSFSSCSFVWPGSTSRSSVILLVFVCVAWFKKSFLCHSPPVRLCGRVQQVVPLSFSSCSFVWPGSTSRSSVILLLFVCVAGFNKSFLCHSPPVRLCGRVQQVVPLSFSSCSFVWPGSTSRSSVILLLFVCLAGFNKSFLCHSPPVRLCGRVQQVVPLSFSSCSIVWPGSTSRSSIFLLLFVCMAGFNKSFLCHSPPVRLYGRVQQVVPLSFSSCSFVWPGSTSRSSVILLLFVCVAGFNKSFLCHSPPVRLCDRVQQVVPLSFSSCSIVWPGSTSQFLYHSPPVRLCGRVQQVVPLSFSSCSFVWPGSTSRSSVILLLFVCVAGFNKSFLCHSPPVRLCGRVQQVVPLSFSSCSFVWPGSTSRSSVILLLFVCMAGFNKSFLCHSPPVRLCGRVQQVVPLSFSSCSFVWPGLTSRSSVILLLFDCVTGFNKSFLCHSPPVRLCGRVQQVSSSIILPLFVCVAGFNKSFLCHSHHVRLCGRVQQVVPLSFSSCSLVWPGSTSRSPVILLLFVCVAGFNKSFLCHSPPVCLCGRVQQVVPLSFSSCLFVWPGSTSRSSVILILFVCVAGFNKSFPCHSPPVCLCGRVQQVVPLSFSSCLFVWPGSTSHCCHSHPVLYTCSVLF